MEGANAAGIDHAPTSPGAATNGAPAPIRPPRIWPGLALVALYWAVVFGVGQAGLPITTTFMIDAGALALLTLAFSIWWLANGTIRGRDRLLLFAVAVAGGVASCAASLKTLGVFGTIFTALPFLFTAWAAGLLIARLLPRAGRWATIGAIATVWIVVSLVRMDGIDGDLNAKIRWRWSPSPEDTYLAERQKQNSTAVAGDRNGELDEHDSSGADDGVQPIELAAGDWPAFRGAERNSQTRGVEISTDWSADPPVLIWKQKIGPGWSSVTIIGDRLFTQEQVGDSEATVALDKRTGRRLWSHEDEVRYWDSQSGAGPRATPTFAGGRLYTQGATGRLNCLDAASGQAQWSRDIAQDSGASRPMWGFSCSPLVVDDLVITYSGGQPQALLAYDAASGKPVWNAASGPNSYSSPQLATIGGVPQVLLLSDHGLMSVEPRSGKLLWQYEANGHGVWRATQPAVLGDNRVLIGSEDLGLVSLEIKREGEQWIAAEQWKSRAMRAGYNDFVVADGFIYGFDGGVFCCVDAKDGERRWRKGRYGHGQVLLLANQRVLLITSETGEAVLVEASPRAHRELGRIQAITGKTWNHPVVAGGYLYVRNDEEIACYRLSRVSSDQLASDAVD
jgi:outer membrane protein assembly factor BamB